MISIFLELSVALQNRPKASQAFLGSAYDVPCSEAAVDQTSGGCRKTSFTSSKNPFLSIAGMSIKEIARNFFGGNQVCVPNRQVSRFGDITCVFRLKYDHNNKVLGGSRGNSSRVSAITSKYGKRKRCILGWGRFAPILRYGARDMSLGN